MYSNEFETMKKSIQKGTIAGQSDDPKEGELSDSFLDLEGTPIRSKKLIYTPTENKEITFTRNKTHQNSQNQDDFFVKKSHDSTAVPLPLGDRKHSVSKKLKFKPPRSHSKSNNNEMSLVEQWKARQKFGAYHPDQLRLNLEEAKKYERGNSDEELETNKTVKMINERIQDFEQEFEMMKKLRSQASSNKLH